MAAALQAAMTKWTALGALLLLGGCATVSVEPTQSLQVLAFDADDRPVPNMQCQLANDRGQWPARTPAAHVPVQRSAADLTIECRRGNDLALGTVAPRRDRLEQALLPFGAVAVAFDHLTGRLYSYPTVIRLRLGQHLRFEFSTEARATELIGTVGETTLVDVGAAPPRQPLPAAVPAATAVTAQPAARPAASAAARRRSAATAVASPAGGKASPARRSLPAAPVAAVQR